MPDSPSLKGARLLRGCGSFKNQAAGPFSDNSDIRGLLIVSATDPMVKFGRLEVELHEWFVAKGILK